MNMDGGRTRTDIGAIVHTGQGIDGILPQVTLSGGGGDRRPTGLFERQWVETDGSIHVKDDASGILTNRLRLLLRQGDVAVDDLQGAFGNGTLFLLLQRCQESPMDILRDFGRSSANQLDERVKQGVHALGDEVVLVGVDAALASGGDAILAGGQADEIQKNPFGFLQVDIHGGHGFVQFFSIRI